jgi:hypothetical protein
LDPAIPILGTAAPRWDGRVKPGDEGVSI